MEDWSQGTPLAYARDLCRYWLNEYDWEKAQVRLDRFPQFRTTIDGLEIHFVDVRSPHEGAVPLVITHGWPGSVVEFGVPTTSLRNPTSLSSFLGRADDGVRPVRLSLGLAAG